MNTKIRLLYQPERGTKTIPRHNQLVCKLKHDQHRSATSMPLVVCEPCSVITT